MGVVGAMERAGGGSRSSTVACGVLVGGVDGNGGWGTYASVLVGAGHDCGSCLCSQCLLCCPNGD